MKYLFALLCSLFLFPSVQANPVLPDYITAEYAAEHLGILGERVALGEPAGIDPNDLTLLFDSDVIIYFISEGADYYSTFGYYDVVSDPTASSATTIFENASALGYGGDLNVGDSVNLGNFSSGTQLGFWLQANGFNNPYGHNYYTDESLNPDNLEHVLVDVLINEGIILLGWEDLYGGGDMDYNDLIIAVDIGFSNALRLSDTVTVTVPEPSIILLMSLGLIGLIGSRRKAVLNS